MSHPRIPNEFVYRKARKECFGKSDLWVRQGMSTILNDLETQINMEDKAPAHEQLDRIESTLAALQDELNARQKS